MEVRYSLPPQEILCRLRGYKTAWETSIMTLYKDCLLLVFFTLRKYILFGQGPDLLLELGQLYEEHHLLYQLSILYRLHGFFLPSFWSNPSS